MTVFSQLGPNALPGPRRTFSAKAVAPLPPDWTSIGKFYLHTAAEWHSSVVFRLEASFRSAWAGQVAVRLYNETLGAEVANSVLNTAVTTIARYRSGPITLVDGHEYRIQTTPAFPQDDGSGVGFALGMSIVAGT